MNYTLIILGLVGIGDTLFASARSNYNLGVILPALLGIPLLLIGLLWRPLCSWNVWMVARWVVLGAYVLFFAGFAASLVYIFRAPKEDLPHTDAAIVLGAAVQGNRMSLTLRHRTEAALLYLEENPEGIVVVSGGQGPGEDISEASAMAAYLREKGADMSRVLVEDKATSTQENFAFSKTLLDSRLPQGYSLAFITSDFHIARAGVFAARAGYPDAVGMPVRSAWWMWPNFYLREYAALVHLTITQ